jgi:hypothetical protein
MEERIWTVSVVKETLRAATLKSLNADAALGCVRFTVTSKTNGIARTKAAQSLAGMTSFAMSGWP